MKIFNKNESEIKHGIILIRKHEHILNTHPSAVVLSDTTQITNNSGWKVA